MNPMMKNPTLSVMMFLVKKKRKFSDKGSKKGPAKKKPVKKFKKDGTPFISGEIESEDGKPNWSSVKKDKKELLKIRKAHDSSNYELSVSAKKIWEKVRRTDCPKDERSTLIKELHKLLAGKMKSVIFSHDMARIVQWLLKLGSEEIRQAIFDELIGDVKPMITSKYSSTCVKRMLKYGNDKMKESLIDALSGSTVKFLSNVISSPIIELVYTTWANPRQKIQMKAEMYGTLPQLNKVKTLSEAITVIPEMKDAILRKVQANLNKFLKKEKVLKSSLVQKVLLEYLETAGKQSKEELLESISSSPIMNTIHLKDGAKVWMMVLWHASKKTKKAIVKQLKGNVKEVAISEFGHLVLLALFDYVDDTVLLSKVLIKELIEAVADIVVNEYGRKVILYLVAHRDPAYFTPELVKMMEKGDEIADIKKDKEVREKELLQSISKPLLELVQKDVQFWVSNHSITMVTLAILKSGAHPEVTAAFEAVSDYLVNEESKLTDETGKEVPVVEDLGVHLMLKKLIQHDTKQVTVSSNTFCSVLVNRLSAQTLKRWTESNRGCFLFVCILESKIPEAIKSLSEKLKNSSVSTKISKNKSKGAEILKKKLKEL
ncbi:pumilio homolog 3 [Bemisia tabaci]|uniref:pumilio homolog 3 n=1 Tax=Bemisia tabaci TaxID=7038 RepID=UPI003B28A46E